MELSSYPITDASPQDAILFNLSRVHWTVGPTRDR